MLETCSGHNYSRNEVRGQGQQSHSDPKMVRNTSPSQDASTEQNLDSFLKQCRRYAPGALILEIRSKVKATVTPKWYLTLCYPKMHPHTKFGVAKSATCLATDACLTADPGVASSIPVRSHTFVEIDHEMISTVILLPSADSF